MTVSNTPLLARNAESIFWMARYMERAENLARLIDVNDVFSRDRSGAHNWDAILTLNADTERFHEQHEAADQASVVHFYMLDGDNPTSILWAVRMSRENARELRPLISTEMWMQINIFYNEIREWANRPIPLGQISRLCDRIKRACQAHTGITEGTFYRDQGWYFYVVGKYMERADQLTRLLDVKYHALLPTTEDVGSPLDISQWNALLRSAAGYHAFRRTNPRGMNPSMVADFLLFNECFPRSLICCVREVNELLTDLRSRYRLQGGIEAMEQLEELRTALDSMTIDDVVGRGTNEFLDFVQRQLMAVTESIRTGYFGHQTGNQA